MSAKHRRLIETYLEPFGGIYMENPERTRRACASRYVEGAWLLATRDQSISRPSAAEPFFGRSFGCAYFTEVEAALFVAFGEIPDGAK